MAVRNKTGLHNALSKATSHFTLSTLLVLLFNPNGNNRWRRFLENLEIENANDGIKVIFFVGALLKNKLLRETECFHH